LFLLDSTFVESCLQETLGQNSFLEDELKQSAANDEVSFIHAHEHSLSVPLLEPRIVTVVKTYHTILFVD